MTEADTSNTKAIRRAKSLVLLLLPPLLAASAIALCYSMGQRNGVRGSVHEPSRNDEVLSATSADATVEVSQQWDGSATVTIYTITGTY
jgi:hypothetical protein